MGIGRISARDLDRFVDACDAAGGLQDPRAVELLSDFSYAPQVTVDVSLDPFSERYVDAQAALYAEISGRPLDQERFERSTFDLDAHARAANPYASDDPAFLTPHALALLQTIWLARLPRGAAVLDMGCGWGLSTELLALCGVSRLTCVDIDPSFVALVEQRAQRRGANVRAVRSSFESLALGDAPLHDAALFYESLHHAVRPWRALERVAMHLQPHGTIIVSGEPIQRAWWPHWGLRLDAASVYCMRKHGWFESGFSAPFLRECLSRAGFRVRLYRGLGLGTGVVGIAARSDTARRAFEPELAVMAASSLALKALRAAQRELEHPAGLGSRVWRRLRRG